MIYALIGLIAAVLVLVLWVLRLQARIDRQGRQIDRMAADVYQVSIQPSAQSVQSVQSVNNATPGGTRDPVNPIPRYVPFVHGSV